MAARQQSMEFRKQGPGLGNAMPAVVGVGMEHKLLSATPHNSLNNNNNNAVIRNNLAGGGALIVDNSMMRSGEEDVFKAKAAVGKNEDDDELNIEHITSMVDNLGVDSDDDDLLSQQQQLTNGGRPRPGNEQQADPSIVFAKKAEPGKSINGLQDWIYRDPQCEIQGPFTNEEMLEWFKAGYFNISLLVRRVCDEVFLPLGDVMKLWGAIPFSCKERPPPITQQILMAHQQQQLTQQSQLQRLLQQQQLQQQQQKLQQQQQQQQQQHQQQQQQQMQMREALLQQLQVEGKRPNEAGPLPSDVSVWGDALPPSTSQSQPPGPSPTATSPWTANPQQSSWNGKRTSPNAQQQVIEEEQNQRQAQ